MASGSISSSHVLSCTLVEERGIDVSQQAPGDRMSRKVLGLAIVLDAPNRVSRDARRS